MTNDIAGLNGFVWWIGIVEDRKDPLKLGRCRVRIVGWHTDNKSELPTKKLPWANAILPLNNSNPYAPKEGDMIIGFFMDGQNAQKPVMMGVMPNIPLTPADSKKGFNDPRSKSELSKAPIREGDPLTGYPRVLDEPTTSRIARNDSENIDKSNVIKKRKNIVGPFEVPFEHQSEYPYNNVYESESGHVLEFDDTPKKERVNIFHKSGSYMEFQTDGSMYLKSMKNSNDTTQGNKSLYVEGNLTVIVDGNISFDSKKNISFKASDAFSVSASSISLSGKQSASFSGLTASLSGKVKTSVGGMTSMTSVSGMMTTISGTASTSVTGRGFLNLGSTGVASLSGSLVNLTGVPVGGEVGAISEVQDVASDAAGIEMSEGLVDGIDVGDFSDVVADPTAVADQLGDVGSEISDTLSSATETLEASVGNLGDEIGGLDLDTITDNQLLESVSSDAISSVLDNAQQFAEDVISSVSENLEKIAGNITESMQSGVDSLTSPLRDGISSIQSSAGILSDPGTSLRQKIAAAKEIVNKASEMQKYATSLPSKATSALTSVITSTTSDATKSLIDGVKNSDAVRLVSEKFTDVYDSFTSEIKNKAKEIGGNFEDNVNKVVEEWKFQNKDQVIDDVVKSGLSARQSGSSLDEVKKTMKQTMEDSWKKYFAENQAKIAPLANKAIQTSEELGKLVNDDRGNIIGVEQP